MAGCRPGIRWRARWCGKRRKGPRATSGVLATARQPRVHGQQRRQAARGLQREDRRQAVELRCADRCVCRARSPMNWMACSTSRPAWVAPAQGDYFAPTLCAHAGVQGRRQRRSCRRMQPYTPRAAQSASLTARLMSIARGNKLYADNCAVCHGAGAAQRTRRQLPQPHRHAIPAFAGRPSTSGAQGPACGQRHGDRSRAS